MVSQKALKTWGRLSCGRLVPERFDPHLPPIKIGAEKSANKEAVA